MLSIGANKGGIIQEITKILKISPLRGAKNRRKTSFLDVSEQVRTTFFSVGFFFVTKGTVGCCVWYRNVSLLFTESIYKLQRHDTRSFHGCRNALLPFGKYLQVAYARSPCPHLPDVFTRVGTRLYHSQKLFISCVGAVPVSPMFSRG